MSDACCGFCGTDLSANSYVLKRWVGGMTYTLADFCSLTCLRAWLIGKISEEEVSDDPE